jgi:uncharacterized protein (DUF2252 family)
MATSTLKALKKETEAQEEVVVQPRPEYLTVKQRMQVGRELREKVRRAAQGEWEPLSNRRDPVEVLQATETDRLPDLLPIRHGRMMQSPLSYLRGAAAMMAYDLSNTPNSGLQVQACGDCHLGNFGFFATPERNLVFDINDFDETIAAPWEWDLKRLAASLFVAGQNSKMTERQCLNIVTLCIQSYRKIMRKLSRMNALDMWYLQLSTDRIVSRTENVKDAKGKKMIGTVAREAQKNVASYVFPKITEEREGHRHIVDDPPLIFHQAESSGWPKISEVLGRYRETLEPERRILLDRYRFEDFAMKVVGVGSVGTRCGLALLLAEVNDPLLLQVKEAVSSVLEPYVGKSEFKHQGQRVVVGQRIIQTSSDIFLGWLTIDRHQYYVRQLKDMKYSIDYLNADFDILSRYALLCGGALAKAHARSGDAAVIAGYLGKGDSFDRALASFAEKYAKQNMMDYQALVEAVHAGGINAEEGK